MKEGGKLHLEERGSSISASTASDNDSATFEAERASSAREITSHDFESIIGLATATEVGSSSPRHGNLHFNKGCKLGNI